jgi:hypothetical protein
LQGETVIAFPVISCSTGEKAAVTAIPIFNGDEITGFIGNSLYMEEVNRDFNGYFNFSKEILFLAVSEDGIITLTNKPTYHYRNIDDLITSDLNAFMQTIRNEENKNIAFDTNEGEYLGMFIASEMTGWKFIIARKIHDFAFDKREIDARESVLNISGEIIKKMNTMDASLMKAADEISYVGISENMNDILFELYVENPYIASSAFFDVEGTIKYVFPREYDSSTGSNVSDREYIKRFRKIKKPVLSDVFTSIEGLKSLDIEWPVFDKEGVFVGSLSLLLKPEEFFREIIKYNITNIDHEAWILSDKGTIIYDIDTYEIGKNLFTDELYDDFDELRELGKMMFLSKEGKGEYMFLNTGSGQTVTKEIVWTTLNFYEREWKLILTMVRKN